MKGVCTFCSEEKELTVHHIMAQSYKGTDVPENLMKNICRQCHDKLEAVMKEQKGKAGAGQSVTPVQTFTIGPTEAYLKTGSALLDETGQAKIDIGSPIYGLRMHHKKVGELGLEATFSGGTCVLIAGSPNLSWVIYSAATGSPS